MFGRNKGNNKGLLGGFGGLAGLGKIQENIAKATEETLALEIVEKVQSFEVTVKGDGDVSVSIGAGFSDLDDDEKEDVISIAMKNALQRLEEEKKEIMSNAIPDSLKNIAGGGLI